MKVGSRFSTTKLKNFSQGKRYSWIFTKQNILIQNCLFCMKNVICIVIKKAALRAEFSDGNEFCQKKKKKKASNFNQVYHQHHTASPPTQASLPYVLEQPSCCTLHPLPQDPTCSALHGEGTFGCPS